MNKNDCTIIGQWWNSFIWHGYGPWKSPILQPYREGKHSVKTLPLISFESTFCFLPEIVPYEWFSMSKSQPDCVATAVEPLNLSNSCTFAHIQMSNITSTYSARIICWHTQTHTISYKEKNAIQLVRLCRISDASSRNHWPSNWLWVNMSLRLCKDYVMIANVFSIP